MVKTMMDGMGALGGAEDVRARMKETGADIKTGTDLVQECLGQSIVQNNHTYSTDSSPEI